MNLRLLRSMLFLLSVGALTTVSAFAQTGSMSDQLNAKAKFADDYNARKYRAVIADAAIRLYGNRETRIEVVGARVGEKTHEVLISQNEASFTKDLGNGEWSLCPPVLPSSNCRTRGKRKDLTARKMPVVGTPRFVSRLLERMESSATTSAGLSKAIAEWLQTWRDACWEALIFTGITIGRRKTALILLPATTVLRSMIRSRTIKSTTRRT